MVSDIRILGHPRVGSRCASLSASKRHCIECGSPASCTVAPHPQIASEKASPSVSRRSSRMLGGCKPSSCKVSRLHRWDHFWRHGSLWWALRRGPSVPNFSRKNVSDCVHVSVPGPRLSGTYRLSFRRSVSPLDGSKHDVTSLQRPVDERRSEGRSCSISVL